MPVSRLNKVGGGRYISICGVVKQTLPVRLAISGLAHAFPSPLLVSRYLREVKWPAFSPGMPVDKWSYFDPCVFFTPSLTSAYKSRPCNPSVHKACACTYTEFDQRTRCTSDRFLKRASHKPVFSLSVIFESAAFHWPCPKWCISAARLVRDLTFTARLAACRGLGRRLDGSG